MEQLPILDGHMHLDPRGPSAGSIEAFRRGGGTHLIVVHKPYHHIRISSLEDYDKAYRQTIELTRMANSLGVRAYCLLGPYPVEMLDLSKRKGLEGAKQMQLEAVDLALDFVDQGDALGLGEVGRIHFPVGDEVQAACDDVMRSAFRGCKERTCPVQLHTESLRDRPDLIEHIARIANQSGIPGHLVIKHYSGWSMIDPDVSRGLSASVQANRKNLKEVFSKKAEVLLETDYIDDPERPNVVMPLDTIPRKMKWAYRSSLMDEEYHKRLMVDVPRRLLGIDTQNP